MLRFSSCDASLTIPVGRMPVGSQWFPKKPGEKTKMDFVTAAAFRAFISVGNCLNSRLSASKFLAKHVESGLVGAKAERIIDDLRRRGERITPARRAVIAELWSAEGALTADD